MIQPLSTDRAGHTQNTGEEIVLEESLPHGVGHLGHGEEEGEKIRQPEVVGGDQEVLVSIHLLGVHIASGGAPLQVLTDIGCSVDPTVGTADRDTGAALLLFLPTLTGRIWGAGLNRGR